MSKYNALWEYIKADGSPVIELTFNEIKNIDGVEIDHSFLNYKKELVSYGYEVKKIALKNQTVLFTKI